METEEYPREPGILFPKTYRITFGRRLYVVLTSIPIAIFIAGILISLGVRGPGKNPFDLTLILIVVAGNCIIFIPRFIQALCTSVTIDGEKILHRVAWYRRELNVADVLGFEVNRATNAIHLQTDRPGKKGIALSVHLEEFAEISLWVKNEFRNISEERYRSELSDIFTSERYGVDSRSRREKFQIALIKARSINIVAVVVSLWALIEPEPYTAVIVACMFLPIIAIWALVTSRGLILLDATSWRVPPTVSQAFMMPALALFFRAYNDYSIVSLSAIWLPLGIGICAIGALFFFGVRDFRYERFVRIPTIIFTVMFVYGVLIEANCLFDPHPPRVTPVGVTSKKINPAAFTAPYRVELKPWQYAATATDERVPKKVYDGLVVGEDACVEVYEGLLGIPWYSVTLCGR